TGGGGGGGSGGGGGAGGGGGGSGGGGSGGGGSGSGGGGTGSGGYPRYQLPPLGSFRFGGDLAGNMGGGTTYFGPGQKTISSQQFQYQTTGGGSMSQGSGRTSATPVALTSRPVPPVIWVLLPVGLLLLGAVAYVVFEPAIRPLAGATSMASAADPQLTVVAVGGVLIRGASALWTVARRGWRRGSGGRDGVGP